MEPAGRSAGPSARRDSDSDFSSSVNKKLKQSSRTGQACDRCKIRKIRCDSSIGSCGPCRQAHQPCRTTDRISGKAQSRGHSDVVENENRMLRETVKHYQQVMQSYGIPIDEIELNTQQQSNNTPSNGFTTNVSFQSKSQTAANDSPPDSSNQNTITVIPLLTNPPPPSNDPGLKLFRGTKLDLFGMQIDGSEFDDEFRDTETAKSYQGILAAMQKSWRNPSTSPETSRIPETKGRACDWATWFFKAVNPYAPILHKPDVFNLLDKLYPDGQLDVHAFMALSPPEKVKLHMMFAIIKHQVGQRNGTKEPIEDAVHHFVTAMSLFSSLLEARSLSHVQALAILALFARNYQKPEAAWFVIHPAVWAAIELGLNRSATALPEEEREKLSAHDIEMRKRVFWVIFGIATGISGRLGRPPPFRVQDIDVEFAEPIHDCLPEETDLTEFQKCSFTVSIFGAQLAALMAQLYSNTFALRRNLQSYEADLAQLEREHQFWLSSIPPELSDTSKATTITTKIYSIYLHLWDLEFQFFLHHPVLINKHYNTAALKKCLEICDQFLPLVDELRLLRCLDSQWIFVSLLLAVIFTTLFVYDVQGQDVTQDDLKKLQQDMLLWQEILGDIGEMQGVGSKIKLAGNRIISRSLAAHQQRLTLRVANAADPAEPLNHMAPSQTSNTNATNANNYLSVTNTTNMIEPSKTFENPVTSSHPFLPKVPDTSTNHGQYDSTHGPPQATQHPQATQSYYADPASTPSTIGFHGTTPGGYNNPSYQTSPNLNPAYNTTENAYYSIQGPDIGPNGSMADHWLRWTQATIVPYPQQAGQPTIGQEYLTPPTPLVELSGPPISLEAVVPGGAQPQRVHPINPASATAGEMPRSWPMNFLGPSQSGSA